MQQKEHVQRKLVFSGCILKVLSRFIVNLRNVFDLLCSVH